MTVQSQFIPCETKSWLLQGCLAVSPCFALCWGGRVWEELPPRQDVPRGTFSELFLVLDAKRATCHCPQRRRCLGDSSVTSTDQSPAATGSCCCCLGETTLKMCFWFNPSHTIAQGTLKRTSDFSLGKASGSCGSACIQRGGGWFFEQNVPMKSCLHFVMGIFSFSTSIP